MSARAAPPKRADFAWFRVIPTRWADNDVYGHVNNVVYYGWFDTAVNAMLIEHGLLDIEGGSQIGLVVETGCRYFAPVAFPQVVEVGVAVEHLGNSSVRYRAGVFTADGDETVAAGHFVHVYVDRESRRPAPLPETMRETLAGLQMS